VCVKVLVTPTQARQNYKSVVENGYSSRLILDLHLDTANPRRQYTLQSTLNSTIVSYRIVSDIQGGAKK